ncbi:MAG TPA: HTH domain-containing protein [Ramlibacter sp.]|nr:HTH domain-containing protein [Ramlibacter sp.]
MCEVVRFYQYKSLLGSRRAVSAEDLMAKLEISRVTLKCDIAKLRDQLHVPIRFDRDCGGQAARRFLEALAGELAPLDLTGS